MIYVYGDDGADAKKERVVAVSVVAGLEEWWRALEARWIPRCDRIPFHAKDCESDGGDYLCIPHENNKAMYRDLVTIVADSKIEGVAIAIDITAQLREFPGSLDLANYRAFLEAIQRVGFTAERVGEVAKLTFDVSSENEYNAGLLYSHIREGDQRLSDWLYPEISFLSAKRSPRVQVADLLAYEGWKALDHTVGPKRRSRKSWEVLRGTGRFETYSYSSGWFADLKQDIESGDLERKVRFKKEDYVNWLRASRRQHNISNLFTFMDRMRIREKD